MIIDIFSKGKMLRNFLIFSLLFAAINADGKFAVLQAPDSLSFQGNEPIPANAVGDIIAVSTGNDVDSNTPWSGLTIKEPFGLPQKVVIAIIEGYTVDISPVKYESNIDGVGIVASLSDFVADARSDKISTCDVDYSVTKATSHKCFSNAVTRNEAPVLPTTTSLSKDNAVDKDFLSAIADLNTAVDNYLKLRDTKDVEIKSVVAVRLSLEPIKKAYGAESEQITEAGALLKKTISKLQKASDDNLFVVVSGITEPKSRSKRETLPGNTKNELNLGTNYDENYPVIFNIILWFMVAFALSLLAISYAIGSMDPGRDSIIYRMTSTRMKKDN